MNKDAGATRRMFLKRGALLAAPVAAASSAVVALADDGLKARVTRLEAEAAIRESHRTWLRQVNAAQGDALLDGTVRRITADHAGAAERIEIAADGRSAVGYFDHAVELETPLATDCTLAQMAHAQGHGNVRRTERRMLTVEYTRAGDTWKIGRVTLRTLEL
jgi:hypothetical protein